MKKLLVLVILLLVLAISGCTDVATTTTTMPLSTTTEQPTTTMLPIEWLIYDFDLPADVSFSSALASEAVIISGHNIAAADYTIDQENENITIKNTFLALLMPGDYGFTIHTTSTSEAVHLRVVERFQQYRIVNESFETGDLLGWTATTVFKGERNLLAFTGTGVVANGAIDALEFNYDGSGNHVFGIDDSIAFSLYLERIGRLRSTDFILGGTGFITFRLGGGTNPALAYLSVRRSDDDVEIARFANHEPNQDHPAILTPYKADLSAYLGETLYLELCDYGGHAGDYLVFDDFLTYHESEPVEFLIAVDSKPTFPQLFYPNQVPNGDFNLGLANWHEIQGSAFRVDAGSLKSNEGGDAATGVIRSELFRVDGSGIITLEIGAAQGERYDKDTYVVIKEHLTNRELVRFANRNHNGIFMVTYYVDLSAHLGKKCYFEIVDNAQGSYDTIFIGNIRTFYAEAPFFTFADVAVNLNE